MSARETILAALRRGAVDAPLPAAYAGSPRTGLTARFVERAADVGAEVHLIGSAALPPVIVAAVMEAGGREVVIWGDPLLDESARALRRAGITVISGEAETPETVAASEFGLTTVDHAIAETGTLALGSAPGRSRAASLLPARHLAVLPEPRIRADLFELLRGLRAPLPSALTFITGPSRTADIGLTPVRPAHGPTTVTIFVVSV